MCDSNMLHHISQSHHERFKDYGVQRVFSDPMTSHITVLNNSIGSEAMLLIYVKASFSGYFCVSSDFLCSTNLHMPF